MQIAHVKAQFLGKGHARTCPTALTRELCKNG